MFSWRHSPVPAADSKSLQTGVATQRGHKLATNFYRTPDQHIMVVPYTVTGDSFKADKPHLWSERVILPRPNQSAYALHPDGERIAVALSSGLVEEKLDKVTFIFNFSEELRRIAPATKK